MISLRRLSRSDGASGAFWRGLNQAEYLLSHMAYMPLREAVFVSRVVYIAIAEISDISLKTSALHLSYVSLDKNFQT